MAANRVAAINPPYRRYGPDTQILQYRPTDPHELAKPITIVCNSEADTEFQYRPHIIDTDVIADAIFADAISETSKKGIGKKVTKNAKKVAKWSPKLTETEKSDLPPLACPLLRHVEHRSKLTTHMHSEFVTRSDSLSMWLIRGT